MTFIIRLLGGGSMTLPGSVELRIDPDPPLYVYVRGAGYGAITIPYRVVLGIDVL